MAAGSTQKPRFAGGYRSIVMRKLKFFAAAGLLAATAMAPSLAEARHHHRYFRANPLPYPISYLHNYGPGPTPGTFAYYDGPATVKCYQSAAAYIGQDRRRHPCF
jgi:hypothetical protein